MSLLGSLFGKRARKAAKRAENARSQAAIDQAIRDRAQFEEESQAEEQQGQQSLTGRGLGNEFTNRGVDAIKRQQARQRAALDSGVELAKLNRRAVTAGAAYNKFAGPALDFLGSLPGAGWALKY